jgi:transcriptional regulator with XRE-family HTH domain
VFDVDSSTLGGQVNLYRYLHGLSQEELAVKLGINESTVFHLGEHHFSTSQPHDLFNSIEDWLKAHKDAISSLANGAIILNVFLTVQSLRSVAIERIRIFVFSF